MTSDTQGEIGALKARADANERRLERIEGKLDLVVDAVAQSRGGIRMLLVLGSIAATVAGLLGAWIASMFGGKDS